MSGSDNDNANNPAPVQGRPRLVRRPPQPNLAGQLQAAQNAGPNAVPQQPPVNPIPPVQPVPLAAVPNVQPQRPQNPVPNAVPQQPPVNPIPPVQPVPLAAVPNVQPQRPQNPANAGGGWVNARQPQPRNNAGPPLPGNPGNLPLPPVIAQPGVANPNAVPLPPPINIANIPPPNAGLAGALPVIPPVPQLPVQPPPVPQPPAPMAAIAGGLAQLDAAVPQLQRRWSVNVMRALGLQSTQSRDRVLASTVATAARVDEAAFPPGQAAALQGAAQPQDDQIYRNLIAAVQTFEQAPTPRGTAAVATLRQAAVAVQQNVQADARQLAAAASVIKQLRPYELRDQVIAMGQPANWTSVQAAQASTAKVELDLLSIANPVAEPLGTDAGVNASFWIKKKGGTGTEDRSYICKPMSNRTEVDGIPPGGEVAREAMAARATEAIVRQTGLPIPIPETHVISLDPAFLPPGVQPGPSGRVTASVQEARPAQGPVKGAALNALAQVPAAQCQAVAIADTIMLNVDRHYGNMLLDGVDLVPIDHGASFIDPTLDRGKGVKRIAQTLGSSHNCLLQMPGTHDPMPPQSLAALAQIDPRALTIELIAKRQEIEQANPNSQGGLSTAALEMTRRSATFVKLAANYPGISAAAIQTAMASAATLLFDPRTTDNKFAQIAGDALARALADQAVTKEACLLNDAEDEVIDAELERQGWSVTERGKAPTSGIKTAPALALKLVAYGVSLDNTIGHGVQPAKKGPSSDEIDVLTKNYSTLRRLFADKKTIDKAVAAEEWACHLEYSAIDPVELDEIERFKVIHGNMQQRPSLFLAKVKQFRNAKAGIAQAEANGGGIAPMERQVIALKVRAAQTMLGYLRGPVSTAARTTVVNAVRANDLRAVSAASNALFDQVRNNMRLEIAALHQANTIDDDTSKDLNNFVNAGKLGLAEQQLAALGVARPNSV